MNALVVLFFVGNVIAAILLGKKFTSKSDPTFKYFGIGLLINAFAFGMWTIGYVISESLLTFVTLGAIAFLVSLVVFMYASLQKTSQGGRTLVTILTAIAIIGVFFVGRASPAYAFISPEGLLFFNLTPFVQMLYIFALAFTTLPLIDTIASKFEGSYSVLVRYGFIAQIVGGIMLITSKDVHVLYVTGWVVGIIYFVLWTTLVFSSKAWSKNH
jgi:heme/copper-type cytochrome/quinol oxidase subunit 4